MSSLTVAASRAARTVARPRRPLALARAANPALALGVAGVIAACAFVARGTTDLRPTTWTEVGLMLAGAATVCAAIWFKPGPAGRVPGTLTVAAFALVAAFTAGSIAWSLAPADSWLQANAAFAYLAVLAGAVALARLVPQGWSAMLYGVALGALAICGWALLTKVFPGALAPGEQFARLELPFEYWNSVALAAATGIVPLLWLGARRSGHAALNALAWPAIGLLVVCLLLAYSRGALLALAVGVAALLAIVPLRLRMVVVMAGTIVVVAPIVAWAFAQDGLTRDDAPLLARADAGHQLGALLLLMVVALLVAGLAVGFLGAQHQPSRRARRVAGGTLVVALALVPLVAAIALARAPGGIDGQVSKAWKRATNPAVPPPSNSPDRLKATASVRARYWREALDVHRLSPWVGTGAGSYKTVRLRFRHDRLTVQHAHSSVLQTLADLGWVGLGLSALGVLTWLTAAARAIGLTPRDRGLYWDPERVGLAVLAAVVVTIAAHATIDWTWSVPGNAVPALLCAGWVAGRGPLRARTAAAPAPAEEPRRWYAPSAGLRRFPGAALLRRRPPARVAAIAAVAALALTAAWAALQPVRSASAQGAALAAAARNDEAGALAAAQAAQRQNPLDPGALAALAAIELRAGNQAAAQRDYERAVRLAPADPETWRALGRFRLGVRHDARGALEAFKAAYYLDPMSFASLSDIVNATRALNG
ncbi:MAG TPA: O-antigen ligase family protein [Solirubrobacteraceae bacterium]